MDRNAAQPNEWGSCICEGQSVGSGTDSTGLAVHTQHTERETSELASSRRSRCGTAQSVLGRENETVQDSVLSSEDPS